MSAVPPAAGLLCRWTILLALAWTAHWLFRKAHARRRLELWRGVLVAGLCLPAAGLLSIPTVQLPIHRIHLHPVTETSTVERVPEPEVVPSLPVPLPQLPTQSETGSIQPQTGSVPQPPARIPDAVPPTPISLPGVLLVVWEVGVGIGVFRIVAAQRGLRRVRSESAPATRDLLELGRAAQTSLGVRRPIAFRLSNAVGSPFLCGPTRPMIVIPVGLLSELAPDQIRVLLNHEVAHVVGRDLFWCAAWQWARAIFWFHPMVWGIASAHGLACEQEADRLAAGQLENQDDYPRLLSRLALRIRALSKMESRFALSGAAQIVQRLVYFNQARIRPWTRADSVRGFALTALLLFLPAASRISNETPQGNSSADSAAPTPTFVAEGTIAFTIRMREDRVTDTNHHEAVFQATVNGDRWNIKILGNLGGPDFYGENGSDGTNIYSLTRPDDPVKQFMLQARSRLGITVDAFDQTGNVRLGTFPHGYANVFGEDVVWFAYASSGYLASRTDGYAEVPVLIDPSRLSPRKFEWSPFDRKPGLPRVVTYYALPDGKGRVESKFVATDPVNLKGITVPRRFTYSIYDTGSVTNRVLGAEFTGVLTNLHEIQPPLTLVPRVAGTLVEFDNRFGNFSLPCAATNHWPTDDELHQRLKEDHWLQDPPNNLHLGSASPDFSCATTSGQPFLLAGQKGKVVLLVFFQTSWNHLAGLNPCSAELREIERTIVRKHANRADFAVIAVGRGQTAADLEKYARETAVHLPLAPDPDTEIYRKYATGTVPMNIVVGKDGKIKLASAGYSEYELQEIGRTIDGELQRIPAPPGAPEKAKSMLGQIAATFEITGQVLEKDARDGSTRPAPGALIFVLRDEFTARARLPARPPINVELSARETPPAALFVRRGEPFRVHTPGPEAPAVHVYWPGGMINKSAPHADAGVELLMENYATPALISDDVTGARGDLYVLDNTNHVFTDERGRFYIHPGTANYIVLGASLPGHGRATAETSAADYPGRINFLLDKTKTTF